MFRAISVLKNVRETQRENELNNITSLRYNVSIDQHESGWSFVYPYFWHPSRTTKHRWVPVIHTMHSIRCFDEEEVTYLSTHGNNAMLTVRENYIIRQIISARNAGRYRNHEWSISDITNLYLYHGGCNAIMEKKHLIK